MSLRLSQACRDPALWLDVRVQGTDSWTDDRWSSSLRWLVPRASGLQTLHFDNYEDDDLSHGASSSWMGLPRVQSLSAVLAARASQLRSLAIRHRSSSAESFGMSRVHFASFPVIDLDQLSQLTSLTLDLGRTPIESVSMAFALAGMPALKQLALTSVSCDWDRLCLSACPSPCSASGCAQLTSLQIGSGIIDAAHCEMPMESFEGIGLLTNLVELTIDHLHLCSLPDSISKLTSLQRLRIDDESGIAVELPSGLTACRQLSQLRITSDRASPVLADLAFLRQLEITQCSDLVPGEMFWPRLTGLTELKLVLQEDAYKFNGTHKALQELVGMTGLRKLTSAHAVASKLPEGPYLNASECICLHRCATSLGLFSILAAATKLRHLELTGYHFAYQSPRQFFVCLESCQALETLHYNHDEDAIPLTWNDALLQFRSRCLAQGSSPVAVSHA